MPVHISISEIISGIILAFAVACGAVMLIFSYAWLVGEREWQKYQSRKRVPRQDLSDILASRPPDDWKDRL